ncbi:MAG: response regulator transcription factor [Candidatus Eremiobacteraeota bacterium]|nr:response regulator transcription factor [Candidatus Eremiobacteraeota bacterium]
MSTTEKKVKILIVDDEEQIRRALRSMLSSRSYEVIVASKGEEALDLAIDAVPDLVILDMSMPGMGGLEVCRELRTWFTGPILILSVRGADTDKIAALDTGADDYITKPFSAGELLARVRALLRRSYLRITPVPVITVGELEIDIPRRKVRSGGTEMSLTPIEFDILAYLAQNADCVVTSKMVLAQVWGPEYEDIQTLRVHISNLRKKIEPHPAVPRYILTEPGVGFRFSLS